jgi:ABC-type transport system involved in multi-copper enzyme maturation permease subunit
MNTLRRIPAVFFFEWRRALTVPRLAWMVALMAFPPLLLALIRLTADSDSDLHREAAAVFIYALSPCVACMMSVFLWATPALSAELEGRSWVYLAVRPHGPLAVLLGKYLVSVSWSIPVGLVSVVLGVIALGIEQPLSMIGVQSVLVVLSCVAYSALFLLAGVIAPNRAMVAGIVYAILFEVVLAMVPAAVNLLTVQYRLRCLLVRWLDMELEWAENSPVLLAYFGDESGLWHTGMLLAMTAGYLVTAAVLLRYREFTAAAETDI